MSQALISVVMPVFRPKPNFLKASIESILSQTYDHLELIVVYDKDGDELAEEVLNDYLDDHRLRVLKNRFPQGFVNSLNYGLLKARGEYIARMDSDDISQPNRFEEQVDFLSAAGVNLVGSWAYVIDMNGNVVGYLTPPTNPVKIRERIVLHNPMLHSSILFQRRVLKDVGLYNPMYMGAEDYEFYLRCIAHGYRLANVPRLLHCIRENPESITRSSRWRQARISYQRAKLAAVTKYGYTHVMDVAFCVSSALAMLIAPRQALLIKRLLGWYHPISLKK
jgi:glycosyltransferase involved in cell wall biosynthesis